jgi:hypothetical protein
MICVKYSEDGELLDFRTEETLTQEERAERKWTTRHHWESFEEVCAIASFISLKTSKQYIPVDRTSSTWPRFDVIEAPSIGDPVSYGFNGDCYPDGFIKRITQNLTVVTDTGSRYRRYKQTGGWRKEGGTWWMINGHHSEQNPHL